MSLNTLLKSSAFALASALLATGMAIAGGHGDTGKITDVLRSYESFVNESDAQGLGALYAEDAILP